MPRKYMPQDVFDMGAALIAKLHISTDEDISILAGKLHENYRHSYIDDGLQEDWAEAAQTLLTLARGRFSDASVLFGLFRHMMFFVREYNLDGSRKRRRIFGGTWFSGERSPNPNRLKDCLRTYMIFNVLVDSGQIPFPPDDWSL